MYSIKIPARYWDDYVDRGAVDEPCQMAEEISRASNRVTVKANDEQLAYLLSDAEFYANGFTDDTAPAIIRGARRTVEIIRGIK